LRERTAAAQRHISLLPILLPLSLVRPARTLTDAPVPTPGRIDGSVKNLWRRPRRRRDCGTRRLCDRVVAFTPGCAGGQRAAPARRQRRAISVGKFDNRSSYMRGIFSDGVDRLGSQAKTILITSLQQSGRFNVLDRDNLDEIRQEAGFTKKAQHHNRFQQLRHRFPLVGQPHGCVADRHPHA
jgi:hypothetical protein